MTIDNRDSFEASEWETRYATRRYIELIKSTFLPGRKGPRFGLTDEQLERVWRLHAFMIDRPDFLELTERDDLPELMTSPSLNALQVLTQGNGNLFEAALAADPDYLEELTTHGNLSIIESLRLKFRQAVEAQGGDAELSDYSNPARIH